MNYLSCGPCCKGGNLILWMMVAQRGDSLENARDVRFSLTGPVNWASRVAQVEETVNTLQEGS